MARKGYAKSAVQKARQWWLTQTGAKLQDGTRLPRAYFRAARKATRASDKFYSQKEKALEAAARAVFGKGYEKKPEGIIISCLFSASEMTTPQKMRANIELYLSEGGSIERAKAVLAKAEKFAGAVGSFDVKFSDSRHLVDPKIKWNIIDFKEALKELEK